MINITSVNSQGQLIEREYDNRTATFYQEGKVLRMNTNQQQQQRGGHQGQQSGMCMPQDGQPNSNMGSNAGNGMGNMPQTQGQGQGNQNSQNVPDKMRKYANRLTWDGKVNDAKLLKIQLGFACNYSCTYCKQAIHVSQVEVTNLEDVDYFIQNFDTWCKTPKEDQIRIELWGGEPLVYIKKVKKLVAFLRERFDKPEFSMITNGSLVTVDTAKWLIENNISITVSHDGANTKTFRLDDPLEEGSKSLEGLRYYAENFPRGLGFNSVMTKVNMDPKKTEKYLRGLFNLNCKINVGFEGIVMVEDMDQFTDDQMWTPDEFVALRTQLKAQIISGELASVSPFSTKIRTLMSNWADPYFEVRADELNKCGMDDPYTLAMNLKGTALVCHSSSHEIGSVYDLDNVKMSNGGVKLWSDREECRTCPVLNICRGACMDITKEEEWYYTCENQFHFHIAIFEAAFEMAFRGEKIVDISGDYVRPKKPKKRFPIKVVSH